MQKISSAVQRVNDPLMLILAWLFAAFLTMLWYGIGFTQF